MIEKPDIQDKKIEACLREGYGITAQQIRFLPLGADSNAWVYQVTAQDGTAYFLKLRQGEVYEPALTVPRYLKDQGIEQVAAPLPNRDQQLWQRVETYHLILYPFIQGRAAMETGMTGNQWVEFGEVLRKIHSMHLPTGLAGQVQKESFLPKWSGMVRTLVNQIYQGNYKTPFEAELAQIWKVRQAEIHKIVARTEELGQLLQKRSNKFVLCHTDIHTANLMLDQEQRLYIVDWDQPLFAPKERDLMFIVMTPHGSEHNSFKEERLFFSGYGETTVDALAIAYYRYEWVVQEIGDYGERIFFRPDLGEETKQEALEEFQKLFQPGDVVETAYKLDRETF